MIFDGLGSGIRNASLAAAGISIVLVAAFIAWFQPGLSGWPLMAVYVGISLVATLSVPVLHRVSGETRADELEWLERRETEEHATMVARLVDLERELASLGIDEGARQATALAAMLDDYHAVVETRFIGKPHGPIEYLATARRVQKHAVQNLTDMVAIGHSLASLSRQSGDGEDRHATRRDEQSARLEALVDENRQLFDALTDTAVEVANIRSFSRFERLDTLARLTSLAEIANRTGR